MPEPLIPKPSIRRAGPDDADVLARIGAETFTATFAHLYAPEDLAAFLAEAYSLERTQADLADPAKASWLVEAGGEAIGYALAGACALPHPEVTPDCRELKRFYLVKAWQNGGLGAPLFQATMDWMLADGPRDIWIGVWSENHGAQRFYERRGFEKAGEYGFHVGKTVDREFILRRRAVSFSTDQTRTAAGEHNFA